MFASDRSIHLLESLILTHTDFVSNPRIVLRLRLKFRRHESISTSEKYPTLNETIEHQSPTLDHKRLVRVGGPRQISTLNDVSQRSQGSQRILNGLEVLLALRVTLSKVEFEVPNANTGYLGSGFGIGIRQLVEGDFNLGFFAFAVQVFHNSISQNFPFPQGSRFRISVILAYGTVAFEAPVLEFLCPLFAHSGVDLFVPRSDLRIGADILRSADYHNVAYVRDVGVVGTGMVKKRYRGPDADRIEPGGCGGFLFSLGAFVDF